MPTVRPQDITVVIPTVFRPPTFQPIVDSVAKAGATPIVIERVTTSKAYNRGIAEARTRYVIIATDDIAILTPAPSGGKPKGTWIDAFCGHFSGGDTWVGAAPLGGAQRLFSPPIAHCVIRGFGGHLRGANPVHRGHLFGLDTEADSEPIPEDMVLYYGDDWYYWRHATYGVPCIALNVTYATGREVPALNTPEHESGWTHGRPEFEAFVGRSVKEQAALDGVAAGLHFNMKGGETIGLRGQSVSV